MNQVVQGAATLSEPTPGSYVLTVASDGSHYSNAQLDDYHHLARNAYPWQPPLRLTLQARCSGDLRGTWGFGFWNAPYSPLTGQRPTWPATAWFFGNGSGDLRWHPASAATGFKAAQADARGWRSWLLMACSVIWWPLLLQPRTVRRVWPWLAHQVRLHEQMLACDDQWHVYAIEWTTNGVTWSVDGKVVAQTTTAPRGPLGLCIWIDNQWLVATPQRLPAWGLVATTAMLEVKEIKVKD